MGLSPMGPPDYFTEAQRGLWEEIEQMLDENYSEDTLLAYVIEFTRWQSAEKKLAENGVIVGVKDKHDNVVPSESMWLKVARESGAIARRLRKDLGL